MGVVCKQTQIFCQTDLSTGQQDVPVGEHIRKWSIQNQVPRYEIRVYEIKDWDIAKMRSFFHAVVLPAYVTKCNETYSAGRMGVFTKNIVKDFLKAKFLGFQRDAIFERWDSLLDLMNRPSDILDWLKLSSYLRKIKDQLVLTSTETLTAERYWNFINCCEAYYFAEFNDMYPVRDKPLKPVSEEVVEFTD